MGSLNLARGKSRSTRVLIGIRSHVGGWLGWDDLPDQLPIPGEDETTLSTRLPDDLRDSASELGLISRSFKPLYRTDVEWAAELSNRTVHAVLLLAWVEEAQGRYRGQLAVYVKPRGRLGELYMALIAPFRHHVVYPALLRQVGDAWSRQLPSG